MSQGESKVTLATVAAVSISGLAGLALWATTRNDAKSEPKTGPMTSPGNWLWPITLMELQEIGESVLSHRRGSGRPHKGLDLFAAAGTEVLSASPGRVLRVVNGSRGNTDKQRRAGLFVDVKGADGNVYRYLHLGAAKVKPNQRLRSGEAIGTVAATGHSGVEHSRPHVHFEVRAADYQVSALDYGHPIDPLSLLPLRLLPLKLGRLHA